VTESIRDLRDHGADQSLQNLLRALLLNLELRSRYRVFEFEAAQDGNADVADLFCELRLREAEQIGDLMGVLRLQIDQRGALHGQGIG
jgi:hypothetical protein